MARWPQAPPYRGEFADVVPHLTVAASFNQTVQDAAVGAVQPQLPVVAAVEEVRLICVDGDRCNPVRSFPLGASG